MQPAVHVAIKQKHSDTFESSQLNMNWDFLFSKIANERKPCDSELAALPAARPFTLKYSLSGLDDATRVSKLPGLSCTAGFQRVRVSSD